MDWSVIAASLPKFVHAFGVTLWLSAVSVILATLLGLVLAVCRDYKIPVLSQISIAVEELFRNTPCSSNCSSCTTGSRPSASR